MWSTWLFFRVIGWVATLLNPPLQIISRFSDPKLHRFHNLESRIRESWYKKRDYEQAEALAMEYLELAEQFRSNWNYSNAIHFSHQTLGLLRLREGKVEQAGEHLLAAGKTPGSPKLDSFGPRMVLARELLLRGEKRVVLQYLDLVANFWAKEKDLMKGVTPKRPIPKWCQSLINDVQKDRKVTVKQNRELIIKWKAQVRKGRVPDHKMWH